MALHAGAPGVHGRSLGRPSRSSSPISLRKRLHVNTLITDPGTAEVEWGNDYSFTSVTYTVPSTLKYTPEGRQILWGRTEYSASFDTVSSTVQNDSRIAHFGDRLTFTATSVVFDGEKLDIAIVPQASVLLRGDSGWRAGATAIVRYDVGRNSAGVTAGWSGATASTATNPAGTFNVGAGYGRRLEASGLLGHFTPHTNVIYERSTGAGRLVSIFEGLECQITEKLAVDLSGQHFDVVGGQIDHQIVVAFTINLGRLGRRRR
ncbi:MAG TPA: hypothetical protein VL285_22270 [Bryobacteraceae bacterium]|nr:hypothetical protein [Bryobacteraceae bacterium]